MKQKALVLALALTLVFGGIWGGTAAWLSAQSRAVVNTFTTSGIDITLTEKTGDTYKMVPGCTIAKDPTVTVLGGSEECWLFVKVEKSSNFDRFMAYEIADGWTGLENADGVYFRKTEPSADNQTFRVIKGDQVLVKDTVTYEAMDQLTPDTYPTLTLTAYACQYSKNNAASFTPAQAWASLNKS